MMFWLTKIKNFLLYLFLFLLPWQTRLILRAGELNGGYWEYRTVSLYAVEIILWAVILVFIAELIVEKLKIKNLKLFLLVGLLLLIGFISALRAPSPSLSFYWLLHFIEAIAIFLIILTSSVNFKKISLAFIGGAVLQAGLGIWQFFTQNVFASKWLGMAAQDPSVLGVSVVEGGGMRFLRAYGGLPHPNILGAYLLLPIVLMLYCFNALKQEQKVFKWFFVTCFVLCVTCLFFTFSRAAWLAFLIVLLFYLFAPSPKPLPQGERKNKIIPLFCILIFAFLIFIFWPLASARVNNTERLEVKSNAERLSGYQESWQLFQKHPWLGVGPGNYTLAVHNEIDATQPSWFYQPVHNVFLLVLTELGIFGFIFFTALWLLWLVQAWRAKQFIVLTTILFLTIFFFFDHFLWSLPLGLWLFWCIMGIILKLQNNNENY